MHLDDRLSGAGKTTVANCLANVLMNNGRHVTVFDGDAVRAHLSKDLGFTKEDRDTNVKRVASLASARRGEIRSFTGIDDPYLRQSGLTPNVAAHT